MKKHTRRSFIAMLTATAAAIALRLRVRKPKADRRKPPTWIGHV